MNTDRHGCRSPKADIHFHNSSFIIHPSLLLPPSSLLTASFITHSLPFSVVGCRTRLMTMHTALVRRIRLALLLGMLVPCATFSAAAASQTPNILFIIMDDVGIDQLSFFNPQIPQPVSTSNLNTLIEHGVA